MYNYPKPQNQWACHFSLPVGEGLPLGDGDADHGLLLPGDDDAGEELLPLGGDTGGLARLLLPGDDDAGEKLLLPEDDDAGGELLLLGGEVGELKGLLLLSATGDGLLPSPPRAASEGPSKAWTAGAPGGTLPASDVMSLDARTFVPYTQLKVYTN